MGLLDRFSDYPGGAFVWIINATLRFFEFVLALTVAGLYGVDLNNARKADNILWTALFGIFGKMYIHENPEGNSGVRRMKNAVWVDLTNMLLWFLTSIIAGLIFMRHRKGKLLHTGRADV
ncbi:MAG: hypothetical protein M1834_004295 [Cirrosporium novae-zelandiae]|nr:MAG: hypothetical protein M1834_004295 [Cirrosporium novae-zelandiae]